MKKKWGSCSIAGIVTLALDLTYEDASFQDYVIAHELLHLKVPGHGRLFKALMTAHIPRWRTFDFGNCARPDLKGPTELPRETLTNERSPTQR